MRPPLDLQIERRDDRGNYTLEAITFTSDPGIRAFAYLLVPKVIVHRIGVIALQQTYPGADQVVGEDPIAHHNPDHDPDMAYGKEMAELGYVVIAPDIPGSVDNLSQARHDWRVTNLGGLAIPVAYAHGYVSGSLKDAWDNMRAIDAMLSITDQFDGRSLTGILAIGHSWGGTNALILGALDPRVTIVIESCGMVGFDNPRFWEPWYIPRLRAVFAGEPARVPVSWGEIAASIAPRALLMNEDSPVASEAYDAAAPLFASPAVGGVLCKTSSHGHHFFTSERAAAYEFVSQGEESGRFTCPADE